MKKSLTNLATITFISYILSTSLVIAKEEMVFTEGSTPSPEELADIMADTAPKPKANFLGGPRGIRPITIGPSKKESLSISFPIKFDYNSSTLNPKSLVHLKKIGIMLNLDKMANESIMIVGHTDATGSKSYNLALSEKRSQSVKEFLVSNYQIGPTRIKTSGKGESSILRGKPKNSPINRRVEFYLIK